MVVVEDEAKGVDCEKIVRLFSEVYAPTCSGYERRSLQPALSMSSSSPTTVPTPAKCRIAEILQYSCDLEDDGRGRPQYHCWPVPRVFRMWVHALRDFNRYVDRQLCRCPGRPAVEITRFVDVDMTSGEIRLPHETRYATPVGPSTRGAPLMDVAFSHALPKGKPWRDIKTRESESTCKGRDD